LNRKPIYCLFNAQQNSNEYNYSSQLVFRLTEIRIKVVWISEDPLYIFSLSQAAFCLVSMLAVKIFNHSLYAWGSIDECN